MRLFLWHRSSDSLTPLHSLGTGPEGWQELCQTALGTSEAAGATVGPTHATWLAVVGQLIAGAGLLRVPGA